MKHLSNILTGLRLILVPMFPLMFFSSHPQGRVIALGIFLLAGLTDFLDGYIARRFHMITELGTVLDPLADKLMLMTVLATLWVNRTLPGWLVFPLIAKETFMIFAGSYLYIKKEKFVIPSNHYGKAATALLFLAIPLRILRPDHWAGLALIALAAATMITALVSYFQYYRQRREFI